MNQNEAISEGLDSVRRSVDDKALRAKMKHERLNMLADVYLGDQIRGKCSRFGGMIAEVERLKLYWRLTPHLVVRTAETAATAACPGYEHEVIDKRKDPVTPAAEFSNALCQGTLMIFRMTDPSCLEFGKNRRMPHSEWRFKSFFTTTEILTLIARKFMVLISPVLTRERADIMPKQLQNSNHQIRRHVLLLN